MFSKYATHLAFAASAIAGAIEPGIYRIINVASETSARSYKPYSPVYVSSSFEIPGNYEVWDVRDAWNGGYTLQNVALGTFATVSPEGVIETAPATESTLFYIEPAGNDEYVIKHPSKDLLWNVEPPVVPRGDIKLRPADGRVTERWILTPPYSKVNNNERWELLQRIGRFLGQF